MLVHRPTAARACARACSAAVPDAARLVAAFDLCGLLLRAQASPLLIMGPPPWGPPLVDPQPLWIAGRVNLWSYGSLWNALAWTRCAWTTLVRTGHPQPTWIACRVDRRS